MVEIALGRYLFPNTNGAAGASHTHTEDSKYGAVPSQLDYDRSADGDYLESLLIGWDEEKGIVVLSFYPTRFPEFNNQKYDYHDLASSF
jgi:hypothetical protein